MRTIRSGKESGWIEPLELGSRLLAGCVLSQHVDSDEGEVGSSFLIVDAFVCIQFRDLVEVLERADAKPSFRSVCMGRDPSNRLCFYLMQEVIW